MAKASLLPNNFAQGGFFTAGKYLVLLAEFIIHQFAKKDGTKAGEPSTCLKINLVKLGDDNKPEPEQDGKVEPREQYWFVGGSTTKKSALFLPSTDGEKRADRGPFVGAFGDMSNLFADSDFAQFTTELLNHGFDQDRWEEYGAQSLNGCILTLTEKPALKQRQKTEVNTAMAGAQDAKKQSQRPQTVIVPEEVLYTPEEIMGEINLASLTKGAANKPKVNGAAGKPTPVPAKSQPAVETSDDGESITDSGEALVTAIAKATESQAKILKPLLKSKVLTALGSLNLSDEVAAEAKELATDESTLAAMMADIGFKLSGTNYVRS
jgi:hypothetical protein